MILSWFRRKLAEEEANAPTIIDTFYDFYDRLPSPNCVQGFSLSFDQKNNRVHIIWPDSKRHACTFPTREEHLAEPCQGIRIPHDFLPR